VANPTFLLSLKEKLPVEERENLKLEREKFGLKIESKLNLNYSCIAPHYNIHIEKC
jgi:hypothetical protein